MLFFNNKLFGDNGMITKIKSYFFKIFGYTPDNHIEELKKISPVTQKDVETLEKLSNDLFEAIANRDYEKAEIALKNGAPSQPTNGGWSWLVLAVDCIQADYWDPENDYKHDFFRANIIPLLLKYNAEVSFSDNKALHDATYKGYFEVVKTLVKHGADIHSRDDDILFVSSKFHFKDILYFLLVDLNMPVTEKSKQTLIDNNYHYALELLNKRDFHKKMINKYVEPKDLKIKVNKI